MSENPFVVITTAETFSADVLERSKQVPVLVDFWAGWCNPCKMLMPILDKLAHEYQGKFFIAKVDTDAERELAAANGIRSLPTVKVFRHGQPVDEFMGALPESAVRAVIERHIERPADLVIDQADQLAATGDTAAAVAALSAALIEDPTYLRLRLKLVEHLLGTGNPKGAVDILAELPANEALNPEARRLRAHAELALATQDGLDPESLAQQVANDPGDLAARLQLGRLLLLHPDRIEEAMGLLLEVVEKGRGTSFLEDARQTLLQSFESMGSSDRRVSQYRRQLAQLLN